MSKYIAILYHNDMDDGGDKHAAGFKSDKPPTYYYPQPGKNIDKVDKSV